jgi:hypothetical protein
VSLGTALGLLAGCGHPASKQECQEIFDRSAAIELELQKVTDPAVVQERIERARVDRGEELLRQCIGRRITDRAMRCVREAKSSKELDQCLM